MGTAGGAPHWAPYGERYGGAAGTGDGFATYFEGATGGLDYARNRYYSATLARFTTPDPYRNSAGPGDPGSWNRYAYVAGDPVNLNDRHGLFTSVANGGNEDNTEDASNDAVPLSRPVNPIPNQNPNQMAWALWRLPAARRLALKALGFEDCNKWLNGGGSLDLATVLQSLLGDGSIDFTSNWIGAAATTSGNSINFGASASSLLSVGALTYSTVSIRINTGAFPNFWNTSGPAADAGILLHELGHALNLLDPTVSHGIQNGDARNGSLADQNTTGLEQNCLKHIE